VTDTPDGSVESRLDTAVEESWLRRGIERVSDRLGRVADQSRVLDALDRAGAVFGRTVCSSRLYAWLTAEPEPEVIVIDLRETYTVGPVVAAIDRAAGRIGPWWRHSRPKRVIERVADTVRPALAESRVVDALAVLLVPPEPPDDEVDS
jgi:hypothetical protein